MSTNREEYIDRMTKDLKEWSETIDEFEHIASRASASTDLQADYEQSIRDLKEKRDLLSDKLRELKASTDDAWTSVEKGVETAKHELKDAFEEARNAVKKTA